MMSKPRTNHLQVLMEATIELERLINDYIYRNKEEEKVSLCDHPPLIKAVRNASKWDCESRSYKKYLKPVYDNMYDSSEQSGLILEKIPNKNFHEEVIMNAWKLDNVTNNLAPHRVKKNNQPPPCATDSLVCRSNPCGRGRLSCPLCTRDRWRSHLLQIQYMTARGPPSEEYVPPPFFECTDPTG